jgi:hypothetical protein
MIKRFLRWPLDDFLSAFQRVLPEPPWLALSLVFLGFALSWWIYVPAHELLHAIGCVGTGGTVVRLEIDPIYGAALLQHLFPFVAVGSEYAGQLTGFDTYGNDWIYLATDIAPFLLSIFVGIPLLRRLTFVERPGSMPGLLFGLSLPVALAPFTNLNGDYYEMGSIVASRLGRLIDSSLSLERWRSDDLAKTAGELLFQGAFSLFDLAGLIVGLSIGVVLAFVTYGLGRVFADRVLCISASRD